MSYSYDSILGRIHAKLTSWLVFHMGYLESYVVGSKLAPSLYDYMKKASILLIIMPIIGGFITYFFLSLFLTMPMVITIAFSVITGISVVLPLTMAMIVVIPMIKFSNRGAILEARFPLIVLYLGSYIASGMSITSALLELYKHKDETKFDVELDYIKYGIYIGKPVDEVLAEASRITPSPSFAQLMTALSSVAKSGMPALETIRTIYYRYRDAYRATMERALNSLGAIFEGYLAVAILVPLMTGVIGALTTIIPVGIDVYTLIFLTIFMLVPFTSLASIIIADITVSRLRM